jgi:hypothetical protein
MPIAFRVVIAFVVVTFLVAGTNIARGNGMMPMSRRPVRSLL